MLVKRDVIDRTHERKLRLKLVRLDQGHDLLGGQRSLQLLTVQQLRFDILPRPVPAGFTVGGESFRALPIATGEASCDQVSNSA